jgi:hypothetical protein
MLNSLKRKLRGRSTKRRPKKWIKGAIRHRGALRTAVQRRYGHRGFDQKGRIRCEVLRTLAHEPGKTAARARLAMRLRGMSGIPCAVPR